MAGKKKINADQVETADIVGSTLEKEPEEVSEKEETIAIACNLPFGLKFTDVPCGMVQPRPSFSPASTLRLRGKRAASLPSPETLFASRC